MNPELYEMESAWASRRKTTVLASVVLVLSAISFLIFWSFWHKAPTCDDGIQNGDETGIDCGGSCPFVCSDSVIAPIVRWDPRLFEVTPGLWSALVYVENPNTKADAVYVPYTLSIYDNNNKLIEERKSATILPKGKTVGIFEGSIEIKGNSTPSRAVFELGKDIFWKNYEIKDDLTITHSSLLRADTSPRVEANVKNNGVEEVKNIEVIVAVFDGSDNVIASSRTFIESLKKDENTNIFFTWPKPFKLSSKFCEKPSDVMLLIDRSGSMSSISNNPPEPLSTAKNAAMSFIDQLGPKDKVGVVSFATNAKDPIDLNLTSDLALAKQSVGSITIEPSSTQYTNTYDALHFAWQELVSVRADNKSSKIIILLTDGVANNPRDPQGKTEADDIKYAENTAIQEAHNLKKDGVFVYTIGLGNKINDSFLKSVASNNESYFFAPTASDLKAIYQNISSDICEEVPARIEITYKIFGDLVK